MTPAIIEIIRALVVFEVVGHIAIHQYMIGRYYVTANGEYYGIWDEQRKTFVD
jgi:hypothetical protein